MNINEIDITEEYTNEKLLDNFIEIEFENPDDFLTIRETLSRIGIYSKPKNTLYQTCHILHKKGRYYIVHFKELFLLDRKPTTITKSDVLRRNKIAKLIDKWGLCKICNNNYLLVNEDESQYLLNVTIVSHSDKVNNNVDLVTKYNLGK